MDAHGAIRSTHIERSSGIDDIDWAALEVANASRYTPGTEGGKAPQESCVKFVVKIVTRDGHTAPDGPATRAN